MSYGHQIAIALGLEGPLSKFKFEVHEKSKNKLVVLIKEKT